MSKEYIADFVDSEGKSLGQHISLPISTTTKELNQLINQYLKNEEVNPYSFYVEDEQIIKTLESVQDHLSSESVVRILYRPEAIIGVRPVSFCSATLQGHSHIILCASFSPEGNELVTGGGDGSAIFWDISTQSMKQRLPIRDNVWLQCLEWHPSGKFVAIGGTDGVVRIVVRNGSEFKINNEFKASKEPIFAVQWEPIHLAENLEFPRIAIAAKGGEVEIYDALAGRRLVPLSGHTKQVMCLAWGGRGILFSASHDQTVKAWNTKTGEQIGCYQARSGAWRTIAISDGFVCRTGAYEFGKVTDAATRYQKHCLNSQTEMIAVGGEDCTISLLTFDPSKGFKEVGRLTGHTKTINHVQFSPNGYWLASASSDRTVKLFDGRTGKFICTLGRGRGRNTGMHIKEVYRVAWSPDSRMLVSGSADTTLKLWDITHQKLKNDLPGHEDAVYAVDWSPAGVPACSGGKDQTIRLWR